MSPRRRFLSGILGFALAGALVNVLFLALGDWRIAVPGWLDVGLGVLTAPGMLAVLPLAVRALGVGGPSLDHVRFAALTTLANGLAYAAFGIAFGFVVSGFSRTSRRSA